MSTEAERALLIQHAENALNVPSCWSCAFIAVVLTLTAVGLAFVGVQWWIS
jgi:hypothetical protein